MKKDKKKSYYLGFLIPKNIAKIEAFLRHFLLIKRSPEARTNSSESARNFEICQKKNPLYRHTCAWLHFFPQS